MPNYIPGSLNTLYIAAYQSPKKWNKKINSQFARDHEFCVSKTLYVRACVQKCVVVCVSAVKMSQKLIDKHIDKTDVDPGKIKAHTHTHTHNQSGKAQSE